MRSSKIQNINYKKENKNLISLFYELLSKIENVIVLGSLAIMGFVMALQVFTRYVLNNSLIWSEEFIRYLFVWMVFIGMSYGVRENQHIRMEVFINKFSENIRHKILLIQNCIVIFVLLNILPYSIDFTMQQHFLPSSAMGIPMSFVIAPVSIGIIFTVARLILESLKLLKNKREETK